MKGYELVVILVRVLWNDNHGLHCDRSIAKINISCKVCQESQTLEVQGVLLMIANVTEHPICRFG
jgi:hypothetical protein